MEARSGLGNARLTSSHFTLLQPHPSPPHFIPLHPTAAPPLPTPLHPTSPHCSPTPPYPILMICECPPPPPHRNPWLSLLHWWSQQDPGMQSCAKSYLTDHALQLTQGCLHLLQNRSNSVALDLLAELSNVSESLGRQLVIGCLKIGPLGQSSGEYSTVNVLTGEVSLSSAVDLVHTLCHPKTPQGSKRQVFLIAACVCRPYLPKQHSVMIPQFSYPPNMLILCGCCLELLIYHQICLSLTYVRMYRIHHT